MEKEQKNFGHKSLITITISQKEFVMFPLQFTGKVLNILTSLHVRIFPDTAETIGRQLIMIMVILMILTIRMDWNDAKKGGKTQLLNNSTINLVSLANMTLRLRLGIYWASLNRPTTLDQVIKAKRKNANKIHKQPACQPGIHLINETKNNSEQDIIES